MASRGLNSDPRKSTTTATDNFVDPGIVENVNENAVGALAYRLWQKRGCPIGSDQEDWFRAESELQGLKRRPTTAA